MGTVCNVSKIIWPSCLNGGLVFLFGEPMEPMTKEQYEFIKHEVQKAYLYLIGNSEIDPVVVELMKLSALAESQRRFQAKEPW